MKSIDTTPCKTKPKPDSQILVIDDEEMIATSVADLLVSKNYKVITCNSGIEALKIFEKQWKKIDLVLLDFVMPQMNGKAIFLAMRKINPNVKVILFSGYSINEGPQEIINDGAEGFIHKPFDLVELLEAITNALNKKLV